MRTPRMRITSSMVALVTAGAILLTGCGGGSSNATTEIVIPVGSAISYVPWDVAQAKGFFADEGLDTTLRTFDSGVDGTTAMLAGQVQVGGTVEIAMLGFLDEGAQLVVPAIWYTGQEFRILVSEDVTSPQDLRGKTIGVQAGGVYDYGFTRWLEENGVPDDSVTRVNVAAAEQVAALEQGQIDGMVNQEPIVGRALEAMGDAIHVLDPGIEQVYTARNWMQVERTFAEANPEAVQGILSALIRANQYVNDNPEESAEIIAERLGIPADTIPQQWDEAKMSWDIYLDEEAESSLNEVARWMKERELLDNDHPVSEFVDTSFLEAVKPENVQLMVD